MTGKISQEERSAAETEKYLRHFPELRLIDDDNFAKGHERLKQSAEAMASCRRRTKATNGRWKTELTGSSSKISELYPRHLLSHLMECGHCGDKLYVSGKNSQYMHCPRYHSGSCDCKTTLWRDLAEVQILEAIAREILDDPQLIALVLKTAQDAWQRAEETLPSELEAKEKGLAEVEKKIDKLLDQCEREDVPQLKQRLNQRYAERDALRVEVGRLRTSSNRSKTVPTLDWIASRLQNLQALLSGGGPAAALVL
jgi:hypothetical protein